MKVSKKQVKTRKSSTRAQDSLKEFLKNDLGENLIQYQAAGQWLKPKTKPTSIALPEETIQLLRKKAARKGIGYQTLLKMIVQEHVHEY